MPLFFLVRPVADVFREAKTRHEYNMEYLDDISYAKRWFSLQRGSRIKGLSWQACLLLNEIRFIQ
jgi:hypothetical protein